jgi:DNA-binding GntR family transcriptional regulator
MGAQTRTDEIVFGLTADIVAHRLAPGDALDEARIGARFGASRTPVREALRQLAASGMVELRPHRAPLVARVDDGRLADMFDVMAELEALCAARAAGAMSAAERAALQRHHDAMARDMRRGDVAAYRAGNTVFHGMIYDGAGNAYLGALTRSTRERLAPYRGAQLEAPERLAKSHREHGEIVTAILRGEAERAGAAMRAHLGATRAQVVRLGEQDT